MTALLMAQNDESFKDFLGPLDAKSPFLYQEVTSLTRRAVDRPGDGADVDSQVCSQMRCNQSAAGKTRLNNQYKVTKSGNNPVSAGKIPLFSALAIGKFTENEPSA